MLTLPGRQHTNVHVVRVQPMPQFQGGRRPNSEKGRSLAVSPTRPDLKVSRRGESLWNDAPG